MINLIKLPLWFEHTINVDDSGQVLTFEMTDPVNGDWVNIWGQVCFDEITITGYTEEMYGQGELVRIVW